MNRGLNLRIAKTIAVVATLISSASFSPTDCEPQKRIAPTEYDYHSLAITSILTSAEEASKLPDVSQRVRLLIKAVKILPVSQHDEAVRLLEVALRDLREWDSSENASWFQRHKAATLRNEVLAAYAVIEPEKAIFRQKEFQSSTESAASSNSESLKSEKWHRLFSDRRTIADQAAKIALSLIDTDPEKASSLVVQSLQGGTVSNVLFEIVQKLIQNRNRAFLDKLEIAIGQTLAASITYDPSSLSYASILVLADKEMPVNARRAFVRFFIRSLQAQIDLVREPSVQVNASYISGVFTDLAITVRPVVSQYSPDQLLIFDMLLDQLAAWVPTKTKSRLQAFQPETFSDPRERLNDILKDPVPDKRDLRLIRLVADLLRNDSEEFQKELDLAADAISGFSDADIKSAYTDLLTITRIDTLVKERKFIEAQQRANSISAQETRAWALLSLSTVAAKTDRVLGFELISNALKAIDKASPSPHKVQLALIATGMLANNDPRRAFETLSAASRYANSSPSKVDPPTKPPVAFGLEAKIGEASTRLGVFPESLGELKIDRSLSVLALKDWFRVDQIVNDIREPSLRLQLKLQMAEGVLAKELKPKKKEAAPKPSVKN